MSLSFDILIILGIVGFYIYDSAHLYFYNEFNLQKGLGSTFKSQLISRQLNVFRKYLFIPNLLLSHQLLFKCAWKIKDPEPVVHTHDIVHLKNISQTLKPLQWINIFIFVLTLAVLPFLILFKAGYLAVAIILVIIYSLNLISILFVIVKRKKLQLSWLKIMQLLLDALLCPPFALNLLRKISLNYHAKTDGILLAAQILNPQQYQQLLDEILLDIQALKIASNEKNIVQLELREQQLLQLKAPLEHP
ncbi:hypothetical protein BJD20_00985 [Acinetobacter proteolyticus]|jgi:hypothetical protein|uniref:Uncharacterized protein n=1 Tax=Acinetobacter proteolyticus TaxID=1776741 RepID=A0A653K6S4_9GAMM|nr:hypothetical protein [Acinetobacter proteolyticus]OEY96627.1 hypothetical protein BJD20_00985 [Acinetobacter proteolyticus]OJU53736.1 MAG: hypothetical protein BGN93_13385 [Acinetobacter sp. 39-4]VXA56563.1 conserved membrane hypothetical protein [Acinetobacter proteolyticus]